MLKPVRVGIIGCGKISQIYTENLRRFPILELAGCADLLPEAAALHRETYDLPAAYTVEELLARPDVELILNLTIPTAHAEVTLKALKAGKHVYSEKPLGIGRKEAARIRRAAQGLAVGCAPDTFLGAGYQTARKLLDDGWIGRPTAASAHVLNGGPESWHPNPFFFYQPGAGPLWDMAPYYLSALVHLLGPVRRVAALAGKALEERLVTSSPHAGASIRVEVATHHAALLQFVSGAVANLVTSFDAPGRSQTPQMEIYGTEGTLVLPDPNFFDGPVQLRRAHHEGFSEVPLTHLYTGNMRGLGVAEMAAALRKGRAPRAGLELALHVVEVMEALEGSARTGAFVEVEVACTRPAAFATDQKPFFPD